LELVRASIFPAREDREHETVRILFRAFLAPCLERNMAHHIAGIDVHKKLLVVVVVDVAKPGRGAAAREIRYRCE
jgi:hypothetical protein